MEYQGIKLKPVNKKVNDFCEGCFFCNGRGLPICITDNEVLMNKDFDCEPGNLIWKEVKNG